MTTIKERLYKLAENKGLSVRAFEEKCGLGRGNISNMSPNGAIGSDKLTKIIDTFPDVDINWILCGVEQKTNVPPHFGSSSDSNLIERVIQQAEEIGQLKERIKYLERQLGKTVGNVSTDVTAHAG